MSPSGSITSLPYVTSIFTSAIVIYCEEGYKAENYKSSAVRGQLFTVMPSRLDIKERLIAILLDRQDKTNVCNNLNII